MATRAQPRPLRRGAMHDEGALYDALYNVVQLVNDATGASMTLEGGAAPTATLTATPTELNNAADISTRAYAVGSSLSITEATHAGRLGKLDTATGSTVTLPAATGSGARYYFAVSVLATSNSHIIKVNATPGTDVLRGYILNSDSDSSDAFAGWNTTSTSDTITLNRSTTGSVYIGEMIEITDIKAGFFAVTGWTGGTGSVATPFSATVP